MAANLNESREAIPRSAAKWYEESFEEVSKSTSLVLAEPGLAKQAVAGLRGALALAVLVVLIRSPKQDANSSTTLIIAGVFRCFSLFFRTS